MANLTTMQSHLSSVCFCAIKLFSSFFPFFYFVRSRVIATRTSCYGACIMHVYANKLNPLSINTDKGNNRDTATEFLFCYSPSSTTLSTRSSFDVGENMFSLYQLDKIVFSYLLRGWKVCFFISRCLEDMYCRYSTKLSVVVKVEV